jgi:hypothetical protein
MKESLKKEVRERAKNCCEHFEWREYFTEIIGISPSGRATVNRLQLNREGLVNLRRILVDAGLHPPF